MKIEEMTVLNRDEWLLWRRQDVTASDLGSLLGIGYRTPLQVWADKAGETPLKTPENAAMRRGRILEPSVFAECQHRHPDWPLIQPAIYLRCPEHRIGCTPDACTIDRTMNVQLKTVGSRVYNDQWQEGPPFAYQLQTLCEAMLLGAKKAVLAILTIPDCHYEEYEIDRNPAAEQRILELVEAFWEDIELGIRPPAEYGDDLALLKLLYPPRKDEILDLHKDNRVHEILKLRDELSVTQKAAEAELDRIKGELIEKLAMHKTAECNGYRITYRSQHTKESFHQAYDSNVLRVYPPRGART